MKELQEIKLVQSPVIAHKLQEAGKAVTLRLEALEIDKQIATVDSVKSLKDLRAELNKELAAFESQRKVIKEGVNSPYLEFENIYKVEISERYKDAIDLLKDKIAFVEDKIKNDKKEVVKAYFNELCLSEKIDFIRFEQLGIEVNLSTSEKKYKEQVYEFVSKVLDDLALIKSTDYEAEILTEYKRTLNASSAIVSVKTRKEAEEREQARIKAELIQNRKNYLAKLGMRFVEITQAYEFNEAIYISHDDVENLSKPDFTAKYAECEAKIREIKAKELLKKQEKERMSIHEPIAEQAIAPPVVAPVQAPVVAPVQAPITQPIQETEPLKTASFQVTATMTQLRALGAYMKANGIEYKNI